MAKSKNTAWFVLNAWELIKSHILFYFSCIFLIINNFKNKTAKKKIIIIIIKIKLIIQIKCKAFKKNLNTRNQKAKPIV